MDLYANEQEQVEAIKKWLKDNGVAIVVGLALGLGGIGGWRFWQAHERARSEAASAMFTQVVAASKAQQPAAAERIAQQIVGEYGDTKYGAFASLMLAKLAVEKQDLPAAIAHLNRVIDDTGDEALQRLARLRLARALIAQDKHEEAWVQLQKLPADSQSAALAELRGDILLAQGKSAEAGKHYLEAYANVDSAEQSDETGTLTLKLDSLGITPSGGAGAAAVTAP